MERTRRQPKEQETKTIKINRQNFIDALAKVRPGLAKKELIEQTIHFIFDNDKIWAYNDQITIMQPFESGLMGAVKADSFYKLLDKIPDNEISISSENGKIELKGKKIKANIKIDPDIKIQPIPIPEIDSEQWEELPENFHEAIAFSAFSASQNMNRPELTCLYITGEYVIGCDSFRGTKYKLKSKMKQEFLLPATAAVHLANYSPNKVIAEEGWLHFMNKEETIFSCRTLAPDTKYPETVWTLFEVEGEEIILPEDFLAAIGRAEILLTADFDLDRTISLIMENNQIVCRGEGDNGWIEESGDIKYNGEKLDIKVHPVLLSEILKHLQKVIVGERLLFVGDSFEHGICLSA